jgi:hypothetical protein
LYPQEHSLITLEQQFSSTNVTPQTLQQGPNNMAFAENYLGMLPLSVL